MPDSVEEPSCVLHSLLSWLPGLAVLALWVGSSLTYYSYLSSPKVPVSSDYLSLLKYLDFWKKCRDNTQII